MSFELFGLKKSTAVARLVRRIPGLENIHTSKEGPELCLPALSLWSSEFGKLFGRHKKFVRHKKFRKSSHAGVFNLPDDRSVRKYMGSNRAHPPVREGILLSQIVNTSISTNVIYVVFAAFVMIAKRACLNPSGLSI